MINQILVVIVLYKTKLEDSLTFTTLLASLSKSEHHLSIYVYDNSPVDDANFNHFSNLDVFYEKDYNNSGISKAYNNAARYAQLNNKKWLLLLDQDSILPIDYITSIDYNLKLYPDEKLLVPLLMFEQIVLSPCRFKFFKGSEIKNIQVGLNNLKNKSIFNSGMLVRLSSFCAVGGYNEKIELDFSDHSFIHRLKRMNDRFIIMPIVINHQLSSFTNDYNVILRRFEQYCRGIRAFYYFEQKSIWLLFWTLLRALKLSLKFRDLKFASFYFKIFKI